MSFALSKKVLAPWVATRTRAGALVVSFVAVSRLWPCTARRESSTQEALHSGRLMPSWSHGAATMGLLPSVLKTQRTAAAQLLGLNKLQSRSMAFALAPNAKHDPLFAATVALVQEYATRRDRNSKPPALY